MGVLPCFLALILLFSTAQSQDDVIYPAKYENQELATMINCQVSETQHFKYSSATHLWGSMGGQIVLSADVALRCLGDDSGGKYKSQALKYRVDVSNLQLTGKSNEQEGESMVRAKRGVGDFFKDNWKKVKTFFRRVFGRGDGGERPKSGTGDGPVLSVPESEEEEELEAGDLTGLYSAPFQFVQLANGSVPEVRFSESESEDGAVRNFKRHLVDAFATHLTPSGADKSVLESSALGEHNSKYDFSQEGDKEMTMSGGLTASRRRSSRSSLRVRKSVTAADVVRLTPSRALNDPAKMRLELQQTQTFVGGRITSSSGTSSVSLLPHSDSKRRKRGTEKEDLTSYVQAHSSFHMELHRRERRSAEKSANIETEESGNYIPASRGAELENDHDKKRLERLQQLTRNASELVEYLLNENDTEYEENVQGLFEMVEREVSLKLDNEANSVASAARNFLSPESMQSNCFSNFTRCKDRLQLLVLAGGPRAERTLLSLLTAQPGLSPSDARTTADILSDLSSPSKDLFKAVVSAIRDETLSQGVMGTLCLSVAHLAREADAGSQRAVARMLGELLDQKAGSGLVDVLEAVGNLGCEETAEGVLQVSARYRDDSAIQIACAHALRHLCHLPNVQQWIESSLQNGDCDVMKGVIGSLMDKIQDQELTPEERTWPRFDFNSIDAKLVSLLENGTSCGVEDVLLYLGRKQDPRAHQSAQGRFAADAQAWEPRTARLRRRALWDDLNCNEWTEDNKYGPIQGKEEFASDRETYNKRKSCLAFRKLGVKGANAEIYAGMFAGLREPSDPPKYKLFTKFVSGLDFLGHQMEIGSFYFYHHGGQTKAYVRILGRTRQEVRHEGCTPTELRYRPLRHIPLLELQLQAVTLSLGVHLGSRLALDTACPGEGAYQLQPSTDVRVGGEAMAKIMFARAAANLGGDFNYKLQFTFTPAPSMCLKGSHGYDPMSISFEAYHQLWNAAKLRWGKVRSWKPSFLSWQVKQGELKSWFQDTCIVADGPPSAASERELE